MSLKQNLSAVSSVRFGALAFSLILASSAMAGRNDQTLVETIVQPPSVLARSVALGHLAPETPLHLSVSFRVPDQAAFEAYAESVSDPKSPNYRKYLTPLEVGRRFGAPAEVVSQTVAYFQKNGFKVTLVGDHRLGILVEGTAGQAEKAFDTVVKRYRTLSADEPGRREFYSFATRPSLPAGIAPMIQSIGGLESFTQPQHRMALSPAQARTLYNAAPIYNAAQQGQGRTIAISNFDGFRLSNVPNFYTQYGLPKPAAGVGTNIKVVTVGTGAGPGAAQGEGDLDIQMVLGQAPLCNFIIYDSQNDLLGVLAKEVNDNLADIISESYGWSIDSNTAVAAHNYHLAMSTQGITYLAASGDYGTTIEPYSYPDYEPEVLQVGGTIATVDATGKRTSEVAWSGSGGGWSTKAVPFNVRPSWQVGTGVPTTNYRLVPDISLHASGGNTGAYPFYMNGSLVSGIGTSFASPVLAGALGLAQQKLISKGALPANASGKNRLGRLQNVIYGQNGLASVYYDIKSGTNGKLPSGAVSNAVAGWDFVTGWGAIDVNAFADSLIPKPPVTNVPNYVAIYLSQGKTPTGTFSQLGAADKAYYTLASSAQTTGDGNAAALTTITGTGDPVNLASMNVTVVFNAPSQSSTQVMLYNAVTKAYVPLATVAGAAADQTTTFSVTNFKDYAKARVFNGVTVWDLNLVTRTTMPKTVAGGAFTLKLDQVAITTTATK